MHQMTKVLLTAPPDQLEPNNTSKEGSAPPLAIYVLASILREHGYSVRIIDPVSHHVEFFDNEVRFPTLEKEINDANVVCISSTSFSWFIARRMIERIKSLVPDIPIIVGGIHATFLDEHVQKNSEVDYVVRGEGEKTLLELLASIENGKGIREVLGISYKDDGKVFRNKDRPSLTIREMEETPLPAFDLMPSGLHELITVESSRGCSFSCAFCSIVYRNLWRGIGTEIFQKRIEHALCYRDKLTGNKGVFLVDDNFTANRSRAEEILGNLSEIDFKDADLSFQARADDLLNSDIIRYCAKIPIKAIGIGAESGYDAIGGADQREGFLRGECGFLVKSLVNGELAPFAEEHFHGLRRQVAVPRADVHDQRIRRSGGSGQGLAKPLINGLPDPMLDDRSMWDCSRCNHI